MSQFFNNRPLDFSGSLRVVTCFMEYQKSLLLVQRSNGPIAPFKWAIPGGKVEKGEDDFEALKRELFEELRLEINQSDMDCVREVSVRHELVDYQLILYKWVMEAKPVIKLNPEEHINYKWCPIDDFGNQDLLEGQYEAFKLVYKNDDSFVRDHAK